MKNPIKSIRKSIDSFVDNHPILVAGVGLYAAATLVVNAVAIPVIAGYEGIQRAVGFEEKTQKGRFVYSERFPLPHGGSISSAKFVLDDGRMIVAYDTAQILEGKCLPNTIAPRLENRQEYEIKTVGHDKLGVYNLVSAKKTN